VKCVEFAVCEVLGYARGSMAKCLNSILPMCGQCEVSQMLDKEYDKCLSSSWQIFENGNVIGNIDFSILNVFIFYPSFLIFDN